MWIFPLAFVAGVHGFAIFAPYLLLIAALSIFVTLRRRNVPTAAPALAAVPVLHRPERFEIAGA
jgi:hypothetical protein